MEQELRNKYNDGGRRGYVEKMKFSAMFGKWILFYTFIKIFLNFYFTLKNWKNHQKGYETMLFWD